MVINSLERSLNTRYLRIIPQSWHNHIAMRIEVYSGETGNPYNSVLVITEECMFILGSGSFADCTTSVNLGNEKL